MSRNEFLKNLKEALKNSLDKDAIDRELDYYDKYISDEVAKGRSESEVLLELGDPVLIAKTIKTVNGSSDQVIDSEESSSSGSENSKKRTTYTYVGGNRTVIGCVIIGLIMFIIAMMMIRLIVLLLAGTVGAAFGLGPLSVLAIILILYIVMRKR